jgi:hypothetical protein
MWLLLLLLFFISLNCRAFTFKPRACFDSKGSLVVLIGALHFELIVVVLGSVGGNNVAHPSPAATAISTLLVVVEML